MLLDDIKVGDKVAYWPPTIGKCALPPSIVTVTRVTNLFVFLGKKGFFKDGSSRSKHALVAGRIGLPTEELSLGARERSEKLAAQLRDHLAKQQREDVRLAERLAGKDPDVWLKLGLERLREIIRELEAA